MRFELVSYLKRTVIFGQEKVEEDFNLTEVPPHGPDRNVTDEFHTEDIPKVPEKANDNENETEYATETTYELPEVTTEVLQTDSTTENKIVTTEQPEISSQALIIEELVTKEPSTTTEIVEIIDNPEDIVRSEIVEEPETPIEPEIETL